MHCSSSTYQLEDVCQWFNLRIKEKNRFFNFEYMIRSEKGEINVMFLRLQHKESLAPSQLGSVGMKSPLLHLINNGELQSLLKLLTRMTSFLRYTYQK